MPICGRHQSVPSRPIYRPAVSIGEIADRCLHRTGPFVDRSSAQLWIDALIGAVASDTLLLVAARDAEGHRPSSDLQRGMEWAEARWRKALRTAASAARKSGSCRLLPPPRRPSSYMSTRSATSNRPWPARRTRSTSISRESQGLIPTRQSRNFQGTRSSSRCLRLRARPRIVPDNKCPTSQGALTGLRYSDNNSRPLKPDNAKPDHSRSHLRLFFPAKFGIGAHAMQQNVTLDSNSVDSFKSWLIDWMVRELGIDRSSVDPARPS